MKYKYYLLALLTGILFLTGCYDDKGNYDYKEINDIVIDTVGFKMTYTVLQYEELQIDPTVAFTPFRPLLYLGPNRIRVWTHLLVCHHTMF